MYVDYDSFIISRYEMTHYCILNDCYYSLCIKIYESLNYWSQDHRIARTL